ncbi:hypothetical protein ACIRPX_07395 [Streptomyces sp. NPDC101225]|uniref:hypothetical protein n=1 Tax=Streptomyces sp. NPDC101225 TaxID=3366135 RepID=UPI00380B6B89
MHLRGRRLKFTAVLGFVVLSLTGFTGHGHHGVRKSRGSHGSSGGGCSSSAQDHDSSTITRRTSYGHGRSGSAGSTPTASRLRDATTRLVSCATATRPYATVEVTNPNGTDGTFTVDVTFEDAGNAAVGSRLDQVDVPANGTVTVRAYVSGGAARVDHCALARSARPVS